MKIEVNITKTKLFIILGAIFLMGALIIGYAYNPSGAVGNPAVMGHSVDEIDWSKIIQNNVSVNGTLNSNILNAASTVCIHGDCRTSWPTNSVPSGLIVAGGYNLGQYYGGCNSAVVWGGASCNEYNVGWGGRNSNLICPRGTAYEISEGPVFGNGNLIKKDYLCIT